ncbi:hypothetical protein CERSUDRAFT_86228 [Gelatoporia subvermispora B]|uniref:Uncharacterized protein n=1 Tax=Ceriporiopsis subvermispora (strain B) TaxID=914234 RepID=M2QRJ7_CERS8|nr:hypothetical protein CERSUDRAFT_86228 [Gelatoporia subvermispora B]
MYNALLVDGLWGHKATSISCIGACKRDHMQLEKTVGLLKVTRQRALVNPARNAH